MTRFAGYVGGAAVALTLGMAVSAQATPVTMSAWAQTPTGHHVTVSGGPPAGGNGTYSAGQFQLTLTSATLGLSNTVLDSWCVDIFQTISAPRTYNATPFTLANVGGDPATPPASFSAAQISQVTGLAQLGNAAIDGNNNNNGSFNALLTGYDDREVSAAIQATIWRILHPSKTITSSNGDTNTLLTSLWTNRANFSGTGGTLLRSDNGQDQLVFLPVPPGGTPTNVPVPGAVLLFGFALAGLAAARRAA